MIRFAHPEYFIFLSLVFLYFILVFFRSQIQKKRQNTFAESSLFSGLLETWSMRKASYKSLFFVLSLFILSFTLPGLKIGTRYEEIKTEGVDIVLALDISASMKAQDIKPSRLDRARHAMMNLVKRLSGDRVALVLFAGEAFVQCPLTNDYGAILLYLESLRSDFTTSAGTDFTALMDIIPDIFPSEDETGDQPVSSRVMIIFSDGEHHGPDIQSSLKSLNGITVFTVGAGSDIPVPIPLYNERNEITGFHQHRGQTVTTARNESFLRNLAQQTGGNYYPLTLEETEIQHITDALTYMKKTETTHFRYTEFEERFQFLLFPSVVFLGLFLLIHEHKRLRT